MIDYYILVDRAFPIYIEILILHAIIIKVLQE